MGEAVVQEFLPKIPDMSSRPVARHEAVLPA